MEYSWDVNRWIFGVQEMLGTVCSRWVDDPRFIISNWRLLDFAQGWRLPEPHLGVLYYTPTPFHLGVVGGKFPYAYNVEPNVPV